jgi:hypothetical protein
VTDYLALPLFFTDGSVNLVTCTTWQPSGFTDGQLAGIEAIMTRATAVRLRLGARLGRWRAVISLASRPPK